MDTSFLEAWRRARWRTACIGTKGAFPKAEEWMLGRWMGEGLDDVTVHGDEEGGEKGLG